MYLDTPIASLSRLAKNLAKRLKRLEIERVEDLLFYFPFRYDDFSNVVNVNQLKPDQVATVKARIELIKNRRSPRKRMILTEAVVADETGSLKVLWFNQPFLTKILEVGNLVYLAGQVEHDLFGLAMTSPSYEKVTRIGTIHTARIVPIYSLTSTLTQKQIRWLVKLVLPAVKQIKDWLPREISGSQGLIDLPAALKQIHFPDNKIKLKQAQERLKFDELFLIQLQAQRLKLQLQKSKAAPIKFEEKEIKKFVDSLPFKLTDDQKRAAWEILQDLGRERPMNRLLEGDVGSGKTIVATMAILNTAFNGYQVAYLAPTEILARQHFGKIGKALEEFGVRTALLTHGDKKVWNQEGVSKSQLLKEVASSEISLVIGTHALIQENVNFKNLALAIIDEQHRFGVEQRRTLRDKSGDFKTIPHLLSMTATPIPRTLALTVYGDLDLSIIKQMPKGRKKIVTKVVDPQSRPRAYQFIREQIQEGRQVFVICPLIDPSDKLGFKSAVEEYEKLNKDIFSDLKIGLVHGRLKSKEKEQVMQDFLENKINILVATSVIEVGIDVPNATIMMIEGAERFGLAQLHQFRGRVGRSEYQSYCFLFTESASPKTKQRLEALVTSENGFELAEKDLEFRGPGEIYGLRQSGLPDLRIASLTDYDIIKKAQKEAFWTMQTDPSLKKWPLLVEKLAKFGRKVHLE